MILKEKIGHHIKKKILITIKKEAKASFFMGWIGKGYGKI